MRHRPPSLASPDRSEGDVNISSRRRAWQESELNAETREVLAEDARWFLQQSLSTPCLNVLARCSGAYIEDIQGRRYLDFHGNSVHQVGFGHPHVIQAIKRQLDELPFCTRRYTNHVTIELARRLAALAPGNLEKVLFAPGGAEAIGMALKLARVVTGRHKTLSMWDSFHGATLEAISVGGEATFRKDIGPLLPGTEHVPPPDAYRCLWDCHERGGCDLKCEAYLEYVLEREGDIAAVIAEPMRSTPYIPPPAYWQRVRAACDRHGALLILDEIYLGLGRTGRMFACEHYNIVPDIVVLGKGLGGGVMPLACMIARAELDQAANISLGHFTHEKSPVAAAAALATLDVLEQEGLVQRAADLGAYALTRLRSMAERFPLIGEVRGVGLLLGIELVTDRRSRERACDAAEKVMYAALSRGLSFKLTMGNIVQLIPPLIVSQQEMDEALDILEVCIAEASVSP
jgi:4-aminobutyrate aminotransferase